MVHIVIFDGANSYTLALYAETSSSSKFNQTAQAASTAKTSAQSSSALPAPGANTMPPPASSEVVETDHVVCDATHLSIATVIKREAILLHEQYQRGSLLSSRQRKIMSTGLSSVLDLVDQSYTSQRKLFTALEWQQINDMFKKKQPIPPTPSVNPVFTTTLQVIDAAIKKTSNIKMGLSYWYKIYGKHQSSSVMPSLRILEHILKHSTTKFEESTEILVL
ncbi:hypothetical protein MBANPS3_006471 [Mucor bainieri]